MELFDAHGRLREAADRLYEVFDAPKPRHIDACPCCKNAPLIENAERRLRDHTADDLGHYAVSLFATAGDVTDFKYYLPRLFELAATVPEWYTAPSTLIRHLASAAWQGWPADEQAAVSAFLCAWLDLTLAQEPEYPQQPVMDDAQQLLSAFFDGEIDLQPVTKRLLSQPEALMRLYSENEDKERLRWGGSREADAFF